MGNLAIRSALVYEPSDNQWNPYKFTGRKKLLWNGEKMEITNFEPANQFVKELTEQIGNTVSVVKSHTIVCENSSNVTLWAWFIVLFKKGVKK